MKVSIYARVSTRHHGQDPENQISQLRRFCSSQKWKVVCEYVDKASGANGERKAFQKLFEDAARREFDVVVFWSLDRFSREGIVPTLQRLQLLTHYGVKWRSYQEPYIDTTHPFGDLLASFVAKIAELEKQRLRERVMAGLDRARAQGKTLGRPRVVLDRRKIVELRRRGKSLSQIAEAVSSNKMTVSRILKSHRAES